MHRKKIPKRALVALSFALMSVPMGVSATSEWGLTAGAGVPEGASLALTFQPVPKVRAFAGPTHNGIAAGARAGAAVAPAAWRLGPVFTAELGAVGAGDAQPLASRLAGEEVSSPVLERVGYAYAAGRAGAELELAAVRVRLTAGLAYVRGELRGMEEALEGAGREGGAGLEIRSGADFRILSPSARLGAAFTF